VGNGDKKAGVTKHHCPFPKAVCLYGVGFLEKVSMVIHPAVSKRSVSVNARLGLAIFLVPFQRISAGVALATPTFKTLGLVT
jgi:hypothetical protein